MPQIRIRSICIAFVDSDYFLVSEGNKDSQIFITERATKICFAYITMKTNELRKRDIKELKKNVQENAKKLSDLRFKFSANQLKNVKEIHNTRKEIAQMLTIIKELENKN